MAAHVTVAYDAEHARERVPTATRLVTLYVFLLFCRILEFLPLIGLGQLRLMMVITLVALVVAFLTGNLIRAFKTPLGALFIALTAWMIVCMPFSTWRSETLDQFLNSWLKSLMVFFIVAGLAGTTNALNKVTSAMGWAAAAACIVVLPGIAAAGKGNGANDRLYGVGTLSNPNEIAFHLWLGMAFLVLVAIRSKTIKRWFLFAVCGLELVLILKTVSREGLLLALLVFAFALLRVSFSNKMKLLLAAGAVLVVGLFTLSPESMDRYLTVFTSKVSSEAAQSAEASSRMRHQKLMESIELTMRHPIFGVGMGVFMPASVEITKEKGGHVDWEVSHNSYTQVSSELGLAGFLLLTAVYVTAFRQVWRIDRAAKQAGRGDIRQISFVLLLALAVLSVHFCFDSMAYVFYMPLITGLTAAFALAYKPLLAGEASQPESAEPPSLATATIAPKHTPAKSAPAVAARNPYRFGRRR
jgi:O-antigen ligase